VWALFILDLGLFCSSSTFLAPHALSFPLLFFLLLFFFFFFLGAVTHIEFRVPYTLPKFAFYEKVAELAYTKFFDKSKTSDAMQTAVNLGSGLIAGFAAAIISQPADTMLSKINKTKGEPGESNTSRLIKIGKELGVRGSFSGLGARLVMVGALTAGQFAIYGMSSKRKKEQYSGNNI